MIEDFIFVLHLINQTPGHIHKTLKMNYYNFNARLFINDIQYKA
jgi:hypothetical protein